MPEFTLKFGILEAAREALHAAPFRPFRLRLHDGKMLRVGSPDVFWVSKGGWVIYDDVRTQRILNPTMVAAIEHRSPLR